MCEALIALCIWEMGMWFDNFGKCSVMKSIRRSTEFISLLAHHLPLSPSTCVQGYPWVLGQNEVHTGEIVTLTTREDVVASHNMLPIMCVAAG
jgi:hypothetical protein